MCGIFGYTGTTEFSGLLMQMGDISIHRGPDDAGYYINDSGQIQFGLRRLSIIDLAGGHQPIANEDETIWLACNGEIYNYLELRADLLNKGHQFRSHSDVEVLVHLYEEYGLEFLTEVNGMFGLVLFDARINRLILARDRLGIKPIYYAWNGKQLAFASEIKPILLCPWVSRTLDWQAISAYLHLFYVPSPRTGFEKVRKLESGTMAILEGGHLQIHPYWQLESFLDNPGKAYLSFEDASAHLCELLKDACRLQLRSDVPIGAFLSGGVDSSAIVALTNAHEKLNMDTFTVSWKNAPEKMDERIFAKSVAEMYGCTYRETSLSFEDFDRLLPLLVWHLEEPNADGAYVPTYIISRFAREKAKVILTGAGGDELFAGYRWYQFNPLSIQRLIRPHLWLEKTRIYRVRSFNFPWQIVFPYYQADAADDFLREYQKMSSNDALNNEMAGDLKTWLQDDVLLLTDKMSMAASLEARVPLLDHRIVEFVAGLPSTYKLNKTDTKVIFKQAIGQYLPHDILQRRKDGFGAPINSWMKGSFKTTCLRLLTQGELIKQGIIDETSLTRLIYLSRLRQNWGWAIWVLLNLELWLRFVVQPSARPDDFRLSEM